MNENERGRSSTPSEPSNSSEASSTGQQPGQQEPAEATKVADLERELDESRSKAHTYLDLAQRAQADFVNYKRRVEQERGDFARSARADIIRKILPAIDDFELAVESLPPDLASTDWVQGVVLVERKLRSALDNLGVKRVEVVGKPFDPWQEEAVLHEPSTTYPPETVTRVVRPGYSLDGRVIRPAQVIVSSGPPEKDS
jgi:molecular chaperone GrpE